VKIPSGKTEPAERYGFFRDILTKCHFTRADRRARYNLLRSFYLFGAGPDTLGQGAYNKIYPHIDQLASFMYSGDTTRFNIELDPCVSTDSTVGETRKIPPMNRLLAKAWNESNSDIIFGYVTRWAFCFGSMFIKPRWKKGIDPGVVDPHNFAVLREDIPQLSRQEAFVHTYLITKSQLANELESANHKNRAAILERVVGSPRSNTPSTAGPFDRIIVSAVQPNVVGSLVGGVWSLTQDTYTPRVAEPLVEMNELYIYDDEIGDYTVVTLAESENVIWDRPIDRMFLKNMPPFVQVCPNPRYDYFWGDSEVEKLVPLQTLRNRRMQQIQHMMDLQAAPPKAASGFPGAVDEMALALDSENGLVQSDMPGAKIDTVKTDMPDDLFREVREIDAMFDEVSGLTNVNQGRGEVGVRSQGHAAQLSKLGSSRAKNRALAIEDALEMTATMYVRMLQRYSDTKLRAEGDGGEVFIPAQFTKDFIAKVDAHSNSPIFMENLQDIAMALFDRKAIDREELIDLLDPPMKDLIKQKLKSKIEPAEARAAEEEKRLKLAQHRKSA
jgi:hypothetical protein